MFHKIATEVAENILYRIQKKRIDLKQKYNLWSGRIF